MISDGRLCCPTAAIVLAEAKLGTANELGEEIYNTNPLNGSHENATSKRQEPGEEINSKMGLMFSNRWSWYGNLRHLLLIGGLRIVGSKMVVPSSRRRSARHDAKAYNRQNQMTKLSKKYWIFCLPLAQLTPQNCPNRYIFLVWVVYFTDSFNNTKQCSNAFVVWYFGARW